MTEEKTYTWKSINGETIELTMSEAKRQWAGLDFFENDERDCGFANPDCGFEVIVRRVWECPSVEYFS